MGPVLHIEFFTTRRARRSLVRQRLRAVYRIARTRTHAGGGNGPWVFRVEIPRPRPNASRLRDVFDCRADEDLWVELAFYPTRQAMRSIIRGIWGDAKFVELVEPVELLTRKRPRSSTVDLARLVRV